MFSHFSKLYMKVLKTGVVVHRFSLKRIFQRISQNSKENFNRSSHPEVFLGKGVLKLCGKFTGENPCRSVISMKLQSNFIEITLQPGCVPVNFTHIFRTTFLKNASGRLILYQEILAQMFSCKFREIFQNNFYA